MKHIITLFVMCVSFASGQTLPETLPTIPTFAFHKNDLEISRTAQPTQYFDKIGPKAGLIGYEDGRFELWVWPWKPLRNFELQFLLGTSTQPILAREVVRTISVTPEVTTITYTYESFTVRENFLIPRNEPGAIILLDVHTTEPLSIIPGFIPVMQPMWPAGVGGQFSYWDDDVHGYVISEGQWRAEFICGSPAGNQMAAPPAHMFADNPLQFRIDVKPGETQGKLIPIIIAGALPDTNTWKMHFDSVKATYTRLWKNAPAYYEECYKYYQNLRHSTVEITSPDRKCDLALEWGKVALDNLMVDNPRLGYGMVAGFGLSGGGERPGFAWFFGGDAFINILSLNSLGMFQQARAALTFTQKWQRQDNYPVRKKNPADPPNDVGKMAHELSQSDGLCDWWNDYHFGYNHADTTPWYIVAMADYVRTSGDIAFLRQSWISVKQAYDWCLSKDSDKDGLMDLKGAGLGALEFGKLVGIYADVYTCGVFVQAIKEMRFMAHLMGDSAMTKQAEAQYGKAQPRMEKLFWLEKEKYYSYGATDHGEQVHEKTPWSGIAMMFGLLDEKRTDQTLEAFNSSDLSTDWGVRSLSNKSKLFDPTNYNYGAVWPFIASFYNTAQFKHHYALAGYQILQANIGHVFDHALGVVPEVFSGDLNEKLGEAYHHQGFSTTGYLLPLIRGLFGLEVDAVQHKIVYEPHFVQWGTVGGIGTESRSPAIVDIQNIHLGADTVRIHAEEETRNQMVSTLTFQGTGPERAQIVYSSVVPMGGTVDSFMVDSDRLNVIRHPPTLRTSQDQHLLPIGITLSPARAQYVSDRLQIWMKPGIELYLTSHDCHTGDPNQNLKFISQKFEGNTITLRIEGMSGASFDMTVGNTADSLIQSVEGASLHNGNIHVVFDPKPQAEFSQKEIRLILK